MMRPSQLIVAACVLALVAGQSLAQPSIQSTLGDITDALGKMEINLTFKESVDMNESQILARVTSLNQRAAEHNAAAEEHNSRPQGDASDAEVAAYNAQAAVANARKREIEAEGAGYQKQLDDLRARDAQREAEARGISALLEVYMNQLSMLCANAPAEDRQRLCRIPSVGPRTAGMTVSMEASLRTLDAPPKLPDLSGFGSLLDSLNKCDGLGGERLSECMRTPFDTQAFNPTRGDTTESKGLQVTPNP